ADVERKIQEIERDLAAHPPPPAPERPPPPAEPPPSGTQQTSTPRLLPPPTAPPPVGSTPAILTTSPAREPAAEGAPSPVYKRWWFWTAIGAAVAGAAVVGVVVARRGEIGDCRDIPAMMCRTVP